MLWRVWYHLFSIFFPTSPHTILFQTYWVAAKGLSLSVFTLSFFLFQDHLPGVLVCHWTSFSTLALSLNVISSKGPSHFPVFIGRRCYPFPQRALFPFTSTSHSEKLDTCAFAHLTSVFYTGLWVPKQALCLFCSLFLQHSRWRLALSRLLTNNHGMTVCMHEWMNVGLYIAEVNVQML